MKEEMSSMRTRLVKGRMESPSLHLMADPFGNV